MLIYKVTQYTFVLIFSVFFADKNVTNVIEPIGVSALKYQTKTKQVCAVVVLYKYFFIKCNII